MSIHKEVYGEIDFKDPLTETEINKVIEITGVDNINKDRVEFEGEWFYVEELVEYIKDKEVKNECWLEDAGDINTYCIYKNKEWRIYYKNFLCNERDDSLIEELESRGYKVTATKG